MIPDILFTRPKTSEEFEAYFAFRWEQLRAPLGYPRGSERDQHEAGAFHAMALNMDHTVIGIGRIHLEHSTTARIRFMAVAPKYHRLGIGGFLLSMLEQYAKNQGASIIWLNARSDVQGFYTMNGYRALNEVKTDLPIGHFRMEKHFLQ